MTDKEILEYSRQLAKYKSDIGTIESAAPDLDEQVKEKFNIDSVNRARFVDSTILIGAATKEFRNIFGVDAPHYELSDECYLAVDRNGNGRFFTEYDKNNEPIFETDECLEVEDPMSDNQKTKNFLDCWDLANAARFDSTMTCANFFGDNNKALFVDKQSFFTDKKKDSTSSPVHNPVCPPGYDMWAGEKVYDKICKCFDLDELNLYRLLGNPPIQTISSGFSINANGDDKFECNINEEGIITKNKFQYKYYKDDIETDEPLIEASNNGFPLLPMEGCTPIDVAPIKWYKFRVVDNFEKTGDDLYCHNLVLEGSPFEKTDLSLVSFELRDAKKLSKFNEGYAILIRNPNQKKLSSTERGPGYYDIEYSINIIWRSENKEGNLDLGDTKTYTKPKKFLWWTVGEKTVTVKNNYVIFFNPVTNLNANVMKNLAKFIYNMENDCLKYYTWAEKRELKNTIPNYSVSLNKIKALRDAAYNVYNARSSSIVSLRWPTLINALKNRVAFDILEKENPTEEEVNKVLNFEEKKYNKVTAEYSGEKSFIERWESSWVPNWPKWLRRMIKVASTPISINIKRITFNLEEIESSFLNSTVTSTVYSKIEYLGPKKGDLTISNGSLITLRKLFDEVLTEEQKISLWANGQLDSFISPTKLKIDGEIYNIDNVVKYEVVLENKLTKMPSYDNIKRAQTINDFMTENESMYNDAFATLADRINKRTGTLREMYSLLESTNINAQMTNQKKHNISNLSKFLNTYEITGGFDSDVITIKLSPWEPVVMAYSNLERMGTVYILADNTTTKKKYSKADLSKINTGISIIDSNIGTLNPDIFDKNYLKATITEIIDKVNDAEYDYSITKDTEIVEGKTYYSYNESTGKYIVKQNPTDTDLPNLYEQSVYPLSGPTFKVTLSKKMPASLKGKNPILVKVY